MSAPTESERIAASARGLALGDLLGHDDDRRDRADVERLFAELRAGGPPPRPAGAHTAIGLTIAASAAYAHGARFSLDIARRACSEWITVPGHIAGAQTRRGFDGESADGDGSGSLLRAASTGWARRFDDPRLVNEVLLLSALSHEGAAALGACVTFCVTLSALVEGASFGEALAAALDVLRREDDLAESVALVDDILTGWPPVYSTHPPGFALACLEPALRAARAAHGFEDGLLAAMAGSGDSDSVGSIAGALLGARFPREVPAEVASPFPLHTAVSACVRTRLATSSSPPVRASFPARTLSRRAAGAAAVVPAEARRTEDGLRALAEAFARDGFVVLGDMFSPVEVEQALLAFSRVVAGVHETGIPPDDVRWRPGDDERVTRELRNVWRSDRALARLAVHEELGRVCADLAGWEGTRLNQAEAFWKPPRARGIGAHTDEGYIHWITPSRILTCWVALDDVELHGGALEYLVGSHLLGAADREAAGRIERFDGPADPHAEADEVLRAIAGHTATVDVTRVVVPAGSVAIHDGRLWHGSTANRSPRDRRAFAVHLMSSDARFVAGRSAGQLGRYRPLDGDAMPEDVFPVIWHRARPRTAGLDAFLSVGLDAPRGGG